MLDYYDDFDLDIQKSSHEDADPTILPNSFLICPSNFPLLSCDCGPLHPQPPPQQPPYTQDWGLCGLDTLADCRTVNPCVI